MPSDAQLLSDDSDANADQPVTVAEQSPAGAARRWTTKGSGAAVIGAAMIAVGEILEPEKQMIEMAQPGNDEPGDDDFDLDFGDLPPLN